MKAQLHAGRRRELCYFRGQQGLEIDFLIPGKEGTLRLVEAKASRPVMPAMAESMLRLAATARRPMEMTLVHEPSSSVTRSTALSRGARAVPWPEFVAEEWGRSSRGKR